MSIDSGRERHDPLTPNEAFAVLGNETRTQILQVLCDERELLAFATTHGVNPFTDPWDWGREYDEDIVSTDPFRARLTFEIDGDSLALTVDEDLRVVDDEG